MGNSYFLVIEKLQPEMSKLPSRNNSYLLEIVLFRDSFIQQYLMGLLPRHYKVSEVTFFPLKEKHFTRFFSFYSNGFHYCYKLCDAGG